MTDQAIRFDDGAAYENMMGRWSALVGERFLEWMAVRLARVGWTWAAAMVPSPPRSSSAARLRRCGLSTLHPANWPLPAPACRLARQ